MPPSESPIRTSRRGVATIDRYGADYIAARARSGIVAKALERDGLDAATMEPEDLEAYTRQVYRRALAHARAAKAIKNAAKADIRRIEAQQRQAEKLAARARARNERLAQREQAKVIQRIKVARRKARRLAEALAEATATADALEAENGGPS